jgi:hypothetical protein
MPKIKNKTVTGKNSQQVLYLQGLLQSIKKGNAQKNKPFRIGVTEKYAGLKFDFEIYPNCDGFLVWRVVNTLGEGLWQSWKDEDEIVNSFREMSLL